MTAPLILYVHIHKTAGTAMRDLLFRTLGRKNCFWHGIDGTIENLVDEDGGVDRYRLIGGHLRPHRPAVAAIQRPKTVLALTREPVSQVVSHFQFASTQDGNALHTRASLEDTLDDPSAAFTQFSRNVQCQMLTGRGTAKEALSVIKNGAYLVGAMERMPAFLAAYEDHIAPLNGVAPRQINVQPEGYQKAFQDAGVQAKIENLVAEDMALHKAIVQEGVLVGALPARTD
ncbi:MAG: hypothetical protein ROR55_05240 [Devosia sp.]